MNECVSLCSKARSMVWINCRGTRLSLLLQFWKFVFSNTSKYWYTIHGGLIISYSGSDQDFQSLSVCLLFWKSTWHCITGKVTQRRIKSNLKAEAFIKSSRTAQIQIKAVSIRQILHHPSHWTQERAAERRDLDLQTAFFVIKNIPRSFVKFVNIFLFYIRT